MLVIPYPDKEDCASEICCSGLVSCGLMDLPPSRQFVLQLWAVVGAVLALALVLRCAE